MSEVLSLPLGEWLRLLLSDFACGSSVGGQDHRLLSSDTDVPNDACGPLTLPRIPREDSGHLLGAGCFCRGEGGSRLKPIFLTWLVFNNVS